MKRINSIFLSLMLLTSLYATCATTPAEAKRHARNGVAGRHDQGLHRGWFKNGKAYGARDTWANPRGTQWNRWYNNRWDNNRWDDDRWDDGRWDDRRWTGSRFWNRWF